jgi:hypothetical protein
VVAATLKVIADILVWRKRTTARGGGPSGDKAISAD